MNARSMASAIALAAALAAPLGAEPARYVESGRHKDHDGAVYALRWSPDGTRIASAGGDGNIVVRPLAGGEPTILRSHKAEAWGLAWSPDGKKIVSVALERGARIWDLASAIEEARLEWPDSGAFSAAWSPDGRTIAVGTATGFICVYEYPSGRMLSRWQAHEGDISSAIICIAWSPDGGRLASGSIDFTAKIWDARSVREGSTVSAGGQSSTDATSSALPHSARAITPLATLKAATSARNDINGLAWSPDGNFLATAGQDGNVRLWDPGTGTQIRKLFHGGWVRGISWSPDGRLLAASGNSKIITLWEAATGEPRGSIEGHASPIWSLQWSPDGSALASGSGLYATKGGDSSLRLWRRAEVASAKTPDRLPVGSVPAIDGKLGASEWADALAIPLDSGGRLYLKTAGKVFYCASEGLYGPDFGFDCLFIQFDKTVYLLHASAQLALTKYQYSESSRGWSPDRPVPVYMAARRTWPQDGWMASVVPTDGPTTAQEFAVDFDRLPEKSDTGGGVFRLAHVHIGGHYRDGRAFDVLVSAYPSRSPDPWRLIIEADVNPSDIVFHPETWAEYSLP